MKPLGAALAVVLAVAPPCLALGTQSPLRRPSQAELRQLSLEELIQIPVSVGATAPETVLTSASTVTVINRRMIQDYGFPSVSAAVGALAGVQVWRTYLKQGLPTLRGVLQEHYANKVLVMIDNVPTWHAVTGEGNLDRISIHDVDRIEVLRGPASVVYGSQAYSGAINIVTRRPEAGARPVELRSGFGSGGALSVGASYRFGGAGGPVGLVAASSEQGQHNEFDFTDERGETGVVRDFLDSRNVTATIEAGRHSFLLNGYQLREGYFGVVPTFAAGAGRPERVAGALLAYTFHQRWNERFDTKAQAFYDWSDRDLSRRADDSIRSSVRGLRAGLSLHNNWKVRRGLELALGGDFEDRRSDEYANIQASRVIADNNMRRRSVSEYSMFGQMRVGAGRFRLVAGTRATKNGQFGSNVSSRGTLIYAPDENNALKLIAGQSFRAPSLFETHFATADRTVFGNLNLAPETSDSLELVYQHSRGALFAQTTVYWASYHDAIARSDRDVTLPDGTVVRNVFVYDNGATFSGRGVELELRHAWPRAFDVFVIFDYLDGSAGDRLPGSDHFNFKYVPSYTVSGGVHLRRGPFDGSLSARYVDSMRASSSIVDAWTLVDLTLAWRHELTRLGIKHTLVVSNLLDERAALPEYVRHGVVQALPAAPGRGASYRLSVSF